MEAIIRTNDKSAFNSLILFLKSLQFEVETKEEKKTISKKTTKKRPFGLSKNDFTVPDNFNEELPPNVISPFYQ